MKQRPLQGKMQILKYKQLHTILKLELIPVYHCTHWAPASVIRSKFLFEECSSRCTLWCSALWKNTRIISFKGTSIAYTNNTNNVINKENFISCIFVIFIIESRSSFKEVMRVSFLFHLIFVLSENCNDVQGIVWSTCWI